MQKYKTEMDQVESEIASFADLLAREGVRSYLEIGCRYGGSLWRVVNALPTSSRVVGVDVPLLRPEPSQPHLEACIDALNKKGYDAHLVFGNSRAEDTISKVASLGPFDAIFIDADHTICGVTADWNNYRTLGRIVAFHDIAMVGPAKRKPVEVSHLWRAIKDDYRHEEFIAEGSEKGIGVLWRN